NIAAVSVGTLKAAPTLDGSNLSGFSIINVPGLASSADPLSAPPVAGNAPDGGLSSQASAGAGIDAAWASGLFPGVSSALAGRLPGLRRGVRGLSLQADAGAFEAVDFNTLDVLAN